ncbi:unnamed protein product, partial [Gadus morhua 'NCC']
PEEPLPSTSTQPQIQGRPEGVQDRAEGVDDSAWRNIADVRMAADVYRQALLLAKDDERILRVKLDMAEDEEDREGQIINFYKAPNIDWARPFQAKLQGDIAIGDGVTRHFLSLVIHKLEHGFRIYVGNSCGTMLFEGQSGHLVPSNSKVFVQNDIFTKSVKKNGNLTSLSLEQKDAINTLAIEMDYPILKEANRSWLLHNILQDVVFGRIKKQLKQLKEGLKETNVLNWMEARPDAVKEVFPSQAEATCSPEVVLELIQWPQEVEGQEQNRIKEFLLQFIRTVSQDKLKELLKFWVGWEIPMCDMKVEVVDNPYPGASTCFHTLRLPSHYETYDEFSQSLEMCVGTVEFGFGLL